MLKVKVWCVVGDNDVGLMFRWDEEENCWVCKMEDDFMQELEPVPAEEAQ